jgi:hypothetical protein
MSRGEELFEQASYLESRITSACQSLAGFVSKDATPAQQEIHWNGLLRSLDDLISTGTRISVHAGEIYRAELARKIRRGWRG